MTILQSSGAISMSDINAQFGRGNDLNAYRGTQYYLSTGGAHNFPSGTISMSDFYGTKLAANSTATVNVLVVAGGGGGNWGAQDNGGGGGGAGGFSTQTSRSVSAGTTYTVTVGGGGAYGWGEGPPGSNGGNSVFDTITSNGGGGGNQGLENGIAGGSGGGGGYSHIEYMGGWGGQPLKQTQEEPRVMAMRVQITRIGLTFAEMAAVLALMA